MHNVASEIQAFTSSRMGSDFHIEIFKFQSQSRDPFEKTTKNRIELRTALYNHLKNTKNFVFEDALDLRNVPQKITVNDSEYYSSLSHTDDTGVFVFDSLPIGVDFEVRERIKREIVQRTCRDNEFSLTTDFQLLWSIKEACFKSVPFLVQPKTMTDIEITQIIPVTTSNISNFKTFRFTAGVRKSPKISITGFCFSDNKTQLAVATTSHKNPI